ncbi:autophagy-related protein 13 homolog isoform X2 [Cimex lectularius]|uniref:Autophagy-related protein 13 n=1 Tax=Cimex lectularius TaxID=79782 RepID=A0A8I6RCR2_CIMLE|nr:autophagy-related protein 13 homolog isoform X2 [Cimex lectularius]
MAANNKLSAQDKKDLDKFTKFLALKSAQIIVQSRMGEKINTKCNPETSGTDWFNLAIKDLPEVLAEAKSAMYNGGSRLPLCVEISLRTVEGDMMILETWCVGVSPEITDPSVRVTYTVYNRMGILLKSLVSVTRVTPAYKLSRRQGPDSYVICYKIYVGEPQFHSLGEGYNQVRVGQLSTPVGTIHLSVAYRTKMTISPQPSKETSIMLKSDHFRPDFSPKHLRSNNIDENNSSLSETIKMGAFADTIKKGRISIENEPLNDVPFMSLLNVGKQANKISPPAIPPSSEQHTPNQDDSDNGNITPRCPSITSHDDFIMKTPFAGSNANTDLGLFYRECQSAPQLEGFDNEPTLAEQVGDLTRQLEAFETNLKEYDNVITELCHIDNNN